MTMCDVVLSKLPTNSPSPSLQHGEMGMKTLTVQMETLRLREMEQLAQGSLMVNGDCLTVGLGLPPTARSPGRAGSSPRREDVLSL